MLFVLHSLACYPDRGVKYRCLGSTRQQCAQFYCETWAVEVEDVRMLQIFGNDSIRRILRVSRTDCVPSMELRRRLCLKRSCKEGSDGLVMPQDVPKVS